jgi:hypothetical protein
MLPCTQINCFWHLAYIVSQEMMMRRPAAAERGLDMPKTATIQVAPSRTLFDRLMAAVDRLLMASARIAIRNDDPPYFGL